MGSLAGGAVGASYLTAAHALHASPAPQAATLDARTAPAVAAPQALAQASTPASPAVPAASPFRFAAVARAPTDQQCLTEAVYFEARGEPETGQKAVAQVILNRVRHPAFPKTICAVVHQRTDAGCQFSFACQAEPRGRDETAWRRAQTVARDALHGAVMQEVGDATHFENVRVAAFAGLLKVARIGEHVFYRLGGRSGAPAMFHQTPSPSAPPRLMLASAAPAPVRAEPAAEAGPATAGASEVSTRTARLTVVGAAVPAPTAAASTNAAATLVPASTAPVLAPPADKPATAAATVAS